jgi:hypothetical protein
VKIKVFVALVRSSILIATTAIYLGTSLITASAENNPVPGSFAFGLSKAMKVYIHDDRNGYTRRLVTENTSVQFKLNFKSSRLTDYDLSVFFLSKWTDGLNVPGMNGISNELKELSSDIGHMRKKMTLKDGRNILLIFFNTQNGTVSNSCLASETVRIISNPNDKTDDCMKGD